jgi:threonine dehydratase
MELFEKIKLAENRLKGVVAKTPLLRSNILSEEYGADIFLKREDLQVVRSYKLRGAYNKISSLNEEQRKAGIVCASAGNHAQGVAYSCSLLKIKSKIFMPATTPGQKIRQVQLFGKEYIDIVLTGDTFDDSQNEAIEYSQKNKLTFIHPFDDENVIAGQGTVALEVLSEINQPDIIIFPVGGGGLASGIATVFNKLSPNTELIGAEPEGAPSMKLSIEKNKVISLEKINKFVDGAAVKKVGDITFNICKNLLNEILLVPEGRICTIILKLYNEEAIVVEPAGALSIAALDYCRDKIKGKKVVCVVSGSNNDILRTEEIRERSLIFEGLKHYFLIQFPQRPGALKEFVSDVLGPDDDITYFQFSKKNNREKGPAVVGVELKNKKDKNLLVQRLNAKNFHFTYLNENESLFSQLVG